MITATSALFYALLNTAMYSTYVHLQSVSYPNSHKRLLRWLTHWPAEVPGVGVPAGHVATAIGKITGGESLVGELVRQGQLDCALGLYVKLRAGEENIHCITQYIILSITHYDFAQYISYFHSVDYLLPLSISLSILSSISPTFTQ